MGVALTYFEDGDVPDLSDPDLFPRYARRVFHKQDLDTHGLIALEKACDFPEVAARFRMIEEGTINVVAPFGGSAVLVLQLREQGPNRDRFRALQRADFRMRLHKALCLYERISFASSKQKEVTHRAMSSRVSVAVGNREQMFSQSIQQ